MRWTHQAARNRLQFNAEYDVSGELDTSVCCCGAEEESATFAEGRGVSLTARIVAAARLTAWPALASGGRVEEEASTFSFF